MKHITTITIQVISDDDRLGYCLGMKPVECAHPRHAEPCFAIQQLFNVDLPARLKSKGVQSLSLINASDSAQIATARAAMTKLLHDRPVGFAGKNYNNGVLDAINCLPKS